QADRPAQARVHYPGPARVSFTHSTLTIGSLYPHRRRRYCKYSENAPIRTGNSALAANNRKRCRAMQPRRECKMKVSALHKHLGEEGYNVRRCQRRTPRLLSLLLPVALLAAGSGATVARAAPTAQREMDAWAVLNDRSGREVGV